MTQHGEQHLRLEPQSRSTVMESIGMGLLLDLSKNFTLPMLESSALPESMKFLSDRLDTRRLAG